MPTVEARIDTHLWVDGAALPPLLRGYIAEALTIPNPAKPTALREKLWGAEKMPDEIPLYELNGWEMKIPRGFARSFADGMAASGYEISWVDGRSVIERGGPVLPPIALDSYQELACAAILANMDAMASAPTGAGKTVISLEAIRRSNQRAIILVEKASLAAQWLSAIRRHLNYEAGYIGEGQWVEQDITVALRQSLWAARDEIPQTPTPFSYRPFWARWGLVLLDEAHHAPAETLVELLQRFSAYIRAGVSATLARDPLTFPIALAVIGPVVHETSFEEAEGRLVRPRVVVYETDFDFPDYHPTERRKIYDPEKGREVTRTIRNNYNEMMAALIRDPLRNELIAAIATREALAGHHCLIVSSRKEHLDRLQGLILEEHANIAVHMLLGNEAGDVAIGIAQAIERAQIGTVLLSTVADEGLDIPRLDRVILAYPSRKTAATKQRVGRVTRQHPLKSDAIVIDFMDGKMKLLRDQFRERRQGYYNVEGFDVEMPQKVAA